MNLNEVHLFFSSTLYCLRGFHFQGQLLAAPTTQDVSYFMLPRRMLKIGKDAQELRGGDIIRADSGILYLVAEHSTSELWNDTLYRTMRLYQVTDKITYTTETLVNDVILGRKVKSGNSASASMYAAIEPLRLQSDEMQSLTQIHRIITNIPLPENSSIASKYRIEDGDLISGLYFYRAKQL